MGMLLLGCFMMTVEFYVLSFFGDTIFLLFKTCQMKNPTAGVTIQRKQSSTDVSACLLCARFLVMRITVVFQRLLLAAFPPPFLGLRSLVRNEVGRQNWGGVRYTRHPRRSSSSLVMSNEYRHASMSSQTVLTWRERLPYFLDMTS